MNAEPPVARFSHGASAAGARLCQPAHLSYSRSLDVGDSPCEFDVFLSHNSKDKIAIRQLAEMLEDVGLVVWLDETNLVPGQPWQAGIEDAIKKSRSAVIAIGKNGLGRWERPELHVCISHFVESGRSVIPVFLPDAPNQPRLPLFLREFTAVDMRKGLAQAGVLRIKAGVDGVLPTACTSPTGQPHASRRRINGIAATVALLPIVIGIALGVHSAQQVDDTPETSTPSDEPKLPWYWSDDKTFWVERWLHESNESLYDLRADGMYYYHQEDTGTYYVLRFFHDGIVTFQFIDDVEWQDSQSVFEKLDQANYDTPRGRVKGKGDAITFTIKADNSLRIEFFMVKRPGYLESFHQNNMADRKYYEMKTDFKFLEVTPLDAPLKEKAG